MFKYIVTPGSQSKFETGLCRLVVVAVILVLVIVVTVYVVTLLHVLSVLGWNCCFVGQEKACFCVVGTDSGRRHFCDTPNPCWFHQCVHYWVTVRSKVVSTYDRILCRHGEIRFTHKNEVDTLASQ